MNAFDAQDALVWAPLPRWENRGCCAGSHPGAPPCESREDPPALRDARADLLAKIIMVQVHEGCDGEVATREETALLERRVLNWLFHGKDVEAELFPTTPPLSTKASIGQNP